MTVVACRTGGCTACVLSHRTGGEADIWWPSSSIGMDGWTACALRHRKGRAKDICWPSSPTGTGDRTARVLRHRTGREADIWWPSSPIAPLAFRGKKNEFLNFQFFLCFHLCILFLIIIDLKLEVYTSKSSPGTPPHSRKPQFGLFYNNWRKASQDREGRLY